MPENKSTAFLNVFLIQESITQSDRIIHHNKCDSPIEIPVAGYGRGKLFIRKVPGKLPKLASIFANEINLKEIGEISSVSAAFLIGVGKRYFVLAFGPGGRFLIKDDVCEERFGLLVALNSVDKNTFRCIDKQSFDTIQSRTRIQSREGTSQDQFGLDIEQDMLKAIVGTPSDSSLGNRMTGMDSLVVSVQMNLNNLPHLLNAYKAKFEQDLNHTDYQWVNNISQIKGTSSLINKLDKKLTSKFINSDASGLWIPIPEIITWNLVKGFIYDGGKKIIYPDINLAGFLSTIRDQNDISLDMLKARRVYCADAEHNPVEKDWSIYKCIYAEVNHGDNKYILNGGKWFRINNDFVNDTNKRFNQITRSSINLPLYKGGTEGFYNESVSKMHQDVYLLMDDRNKILHGGGKGQVEFCDLFSRKKEIIHIKRYGQSSVFSHLFSQGFVSGQLLQLDGEFREKVVKKMKAPFCDLIKRESRPKDREFTIVFGIISESEGKDLHLSFFSRVNLNNAARALLGFGYKVELLKIRVDHTYAKTRIIPLAKKKDN